MAIIIQKIQMGLDSKTSTTLEPTEYTCVVVRFLPSSANKIGMDGLYCKILGWNVPFSLHTQKGRYNYNPASKDNYTGVRNGR